MKILGIDTSATAASVAIADENKIIGEFSIFFRCAAVEISVYAGDVLG